MISKLNMYEKPKSNNNRSVVFQNVCSYIGFFFQKKTTFLY